MSDPAADLEPAPVPVHYPERDGKPMGETPVHGRAIRYLWGDLEEYFRDDPEVFAGADNFLYYREGDPGSSVVPDVFVTRGIPRDRRRDVYKLWEEGVAPQIVIEVTSKSSQREDLWRKRALYERLGIAEYLLFDPRGEYLEPRFQAHRLGADGSYQPVELAEGAPFVSESLGLGFLPEGETLRLLDPDGNPILRQGEARRHAEEEARRAEEEARRAEEQARRAEQATRRAEQATRHAEQATRHAEQATRHAEEEAQRAETLEREVERLRRRLGEAGEDPTSGE